ncbi:putative glycosyl transferase [Geobacter sp. OR-1]|uniref:glycosyltransferase n=1 Tax=Geobacter sp. OR-1 TaxID=1266765 RepID=UPI0005429201|nr:glycosyltransferase family A protein [Geobacter sp. OR-1]GAM11526.1 putative glycosyl transferase [Geobacter sp. OR-1]
MAANGLRAKVLQGLYRIFPFDLSGDCNLNASSDGIRISCVINFFGRLDLLSGILHSLAGQKMPRELFEVILVEDRGGTSDGKKCAEEFSTSLQTRYIPLDSHYGKMGYSRNTGLAATKGEIVLFLDDDTVILQPDFLEILYATFSLNPSVDAVVPHGNASFALTEDKYDYHDPYFMTSRCTAYRRAVLADLAGFVSDFVGQEDVEFVTRFNITGKTAMNCPDLNYFHPPMLVPNLRKPKAVGYSFYRLKSRYSFVLWLLLLFNCARHAPLLFIPVRRFREQGRFGVGFLFGIIEGVRGGRAQSYS